MRNFNMQIIWVLSVVYLAFVVESKTIFKTSTSDAFSHNGSILAEKIQQSSYSDLSSFYQQCEGSGLPQDVVGEAITLAYAGNLENVDKVLNFIKDISCPSTKYVGFATLFDELESNGHQRTNEMMTLISWIKLAMSEVNMDNKLQSSYYQLKAKLPSDMRAIMFQELVVIKNVEENEYMYESSEYVDGHRIILTWIPGGTVSQSYFYFERRLENDKLYFIIRNDVYGIGSPMCQSSSYFNSDRRKTVTCPNEPISNSMKWLVEPRNNTDYFTITNWDGTDLYSPNNQHLYDEERRYVFTWQNSETLETKRYWNIELLK